MAKKSVSDWTSRFVKADSEPKPRIIGLSYGEVGTAKTSFWLGGPGPIAYFGFDAGLEGVVEAFQEDKDILVKEYEWNPTEDTSKEDAEALRDEFLEDYEAALQGARTVIIDKGTQLWEIMRYAEFGAMNDAPRNYPMLNQKMRKIINAPKALDINFGIIDGMKDQWVTKGKEGGGTKGVNTGARVRKGFDEAEELVHVTLFHERVDGEFRYTVGKSRGPGGHNVQDQTFTIENDVDAMKEAFRTFAQLVFPDSDESDWI
jgi:hypothetical protein